MSIVGPHDLPGIPTQTTEVQDFNTLGNNIFNQGKYREAIVEYNRALAIIVFGSKLIVDFAPNDPLILWNRSAAYVLLGNYRTHYS